MNGLATQSLMGEGKVGVKVLLVIIFRRCTIISVAGFHSENSLLDKKIPSLPSGHVR
jgi:hypothetical protein